MNNIFNKIGEYFIGIGILIITGILFTNVLLRYIFSTSIEWAEEITRYGIMWITFVGASICIYKGAHLGIDLVIDALEKRGFKFYTIIVDILATIFSIIFAILSWEMTVKIYETGQISSILGIPMYFVYAALPVSGVLMALRFIQQIFKNFSKQTE